MSTVMEPEVAAPETKEQKVIVIEESAESKVIGRAIGLLRKYGWLRAWGSYQEGYCLWGALSRAAWDTGYVGLTDLAPNEPEILKGYTADNLLPAISETLRTKHPVWKNAHSIQWNDGTAKNREEVIRHLEWVRTQV